LEDDKNKKGRATKGFSFGSSAMLRLAQHPPLSPPHERFGFIGIKIIWIFFFLKKAFKDI